MVKIVKNMRSIKLLRSRAAFTNQVLQDMNYVYKNQANLEATDEETDRGIDISPLPAGMRESKNNVSVAPSHNTKAHETDRSKASKKESIANMWEMDEFTEEALRKRQREIEEGSEVAGSMARGKRDTR